MPVMVLIYFTVHAFPLSIFSLPRYYAYVFLYAYPTHLNLAHLSFLVISSTPSLVLISSVPITHLNILIPDIFSLLLFSLLQYSLTGVVHVNKPMA